MAESPEAFTRLCTLIVEHINTVLNPVDHDSQAITAERNYSPNFDQPGGAKIYVFPGTYRANPEAIRTVDMRYEPDIVVAQKVPEEDDLTAVCDALIFVTRQLRGMVNEDLIDTGDTGIRFYCEAMRDRPAYDQTWLWEKRIFIANTTLIYRSNEES